MRVARPVRRAGPGKRARSNPGTAPRPDPTKGVWSESEGDETVSMTVSEERAVRPREVAEALKASGGVGVGSSLRSMLVPR